MKNAAHEAQLRDPHKEPQPNYTFGDSDLAARRLAVVAEVFAESSRLFIRGATAGPVDLAVDLGCGPGFTTHLLAAATGASRTVGLDNSEAFLRLAQATRNEAVGFRRHDVTTMPLPVPAADVLYGRFLLTHLAEPLDVLTRWSTALSPGGSLLVDEVERVKTHDPVLIRYQDAVNALLRSRGQQLEIGPRLDAWIPPPGLRRAASQTVIVTPSSRQIGAMFLANLRSWRSDEVLIDTFGLTHLDDLEDQLAAVASGEVSASGQWEMRQIHFVRC